MLLRYSRQLVEAVGHLDLGDKELFGVITCVSLIYLTLEKDDTSLLPSSLY